MAVDSGLNFNSVVEVRKEFFSAIAEAQRKKQEKVRYPDGATLEADETGADRHNRGDLSFTRVIIGMVQRGNPDSP